MAATSHGGASANSQLRHVLFSHRSNSWQYIMWYSYEKSLEVV
jgi:hypothetical protein